VLGGGDPRAASRSIQLCRVGVITTAFGVASLRRGSSFVVNLVKLPIYTGHGLIGRRSLLFDLALAPSVVAGALLGRALLHRLPQAVFDRLVMALTVCAAALLLVPR
jgi:uncharacterized membrane protein YfcA